MSLPLAELIAARLRELRAQTCLTQEQVAARLGADIRWYQRLELGVKDVRVSTVDRLAAIYGLSATEFLAERLPKARVVPPAPTAPHKPRKTAGRRPIPPRK